VSRLYELVPTSENVVVYNEKSGHVQVLTPEGAVFDRPDTTDVRNMSIAFGLLLTSNQWRMATEEEIAEWQAHPPVPMLALNWTVPPPRPRPKLTIVTKE